jgi:hypothetical protein
MALEYFQPSGLRISLFQGTQQRTAPPHLPLGVLTFSYVPHIFWVNYQNLIFWISSSSPGDGMALHNFGNDFFTLLTSDRTDENLESMLSDEWYSRWGGKNGDRVRFTH